MRFLLHPTARIKIRQALPSSASSTRRGRNGGDSGCGGSDGTVPTNTKASSSSSSCHHHPTSTTTERTNSNTTKTIWGQQCSENCGCVVRFQANIDYGSSSTSMPMVTSIQYTAKTVVTGMDPQTKQRNVLYTTKGRPMLQPCHCTTVHTLSAAIVHYIQQNPNFHRLSSELCNFEQLRSSISFRQAVLSVHELPTTTTHCFDMVEEAITALMKGYLPKPRRSNYDYHNNTMDPNNNDMENYYDNENENYSYYNQQQQQSSTEQLQEQGHNGSIIPNNNVNNTFFNNSGSSSSNSRTELPFGNLFQSSIDETTVKANKFSSFFFSPSNTSSTLSMYDMALAKQQDEEEEERQKQQQQYENYMSKWKQQQRQRKHIRDWVSYVDYQYHEEESSPA